MSTATIEKPSTLNQINCPRCKSDNIIKNGRRGDRQKYKCKNCHRHFQQAKELKCDRQPSSPNVIKNKLQIPDRALILITSHRSGSTWLSDAIRCHPFVEYYPSWVLYEKLNLNGGRYPGDLSNCADGTYKIEVRPQKWIKIPQFDLTPDLSPTLQKFKFEPYAVEKCHPSFFDFNPDAFLNGVTSLKNLGVAVKLVYVVRDPKSLITSFMEYQKRNSSWYEGRVGERIIDLVTKTFKCIKQLSEKQSGLILDYADTRTDMAAALLKIYQMLWTKSNNTKQKYLIETAKLAVKYTDRKQRLIKTNSPFLGEQEGTISGGDERYQDFFQTHDELMQQCYFWYRQIISPSQN